VSDLHRRAVAIELAELGGGSDLDFTSSDPGSDLDFTSTPFASDELARMAWLAELGELDAAGDRAEALARRARRRAWARALAELLAQAAMGGPQTIVTDDGKAGGFEYRRAPSSNSDWWQELPAGVTHAEMHRALDRVRRGLPLRLRRKADRWLERTIRRARVVGFVATFDGQASPLEIEPDPDVSGEDVRPAIAAKRKPVYVSLPIQLRARFKRAADRLRVSASELAEAFLPDDLDELDD
jgi:hypothetical protein